MAVHGERRKRNKSKGLVLPPAPQWEKEDKRYEVQCDLDALTRAEAIKADPERMKLCQMLAKEKLEESKRRKAEAQAMIEMAAEA